MSTISFIGAGSMAEAFAGRAAEAGHAVEMIGRNAAKTRELADRLPSGVTTKAYGAAPGGDIVILAVPYASAAAVVTDLGAALDGKVIIDITNSVAPDLAGLLAPRGSSGAQEIAKGIPATAHLVKAFNTIFGHVLARGGRLDAFIAGDDPEAKTLVSTFIDSLGLRPFDVGGLRMARTLEEVGLMMIGLANNGAGTWDFSLTVDTR
jgi:8-hydroxy-5-deazaflavin:NADPH oxidoreductase